MATDGDATEIDAAVDAWAAAGCRLDEGSRRAVVAAVVHALDGGRSASWLDALYRFDPSLSLRIEDARSLRGVLHDVLVAPRPASEALDLQLRLGQLIDELVAAAAERRVRTFEQTAMVDPLTGLLNRRAFDASFASALAHGKRHDRAVSLAMVDLDGLKRINDTLGHAAGDDALRAFAAALTQGLRAGDDAFRIGGDEFVVLAPDTTSEDLGVVMRRIATTAPAFSVGIAEMPADGDDAAAILSVADARLYGTRRVVAAGRRPPLLDRTTVGLIALVFAGVAAALAEGARRALGVDATGAAAAAWQTILVAAPIGCAVVAGTRGRASTIGAVRRGSAMAGMSLLLMIAAMTPLFVRTAGPDHKNELAEGPRQTPPVTGSTTSTTALPFRNDTPTTAVTTTPTTTTPTTASSTPGTPGGNPAVNVGGPTVTPPVAGTIDRSPRVPVTTTTTVVAGTPQVTPSTTVVLTPIVQPPAPAPTPVPVAKPPTTTTTTTTTTPTPNPSTPDTPSKPGRTSAHRSNPGTRPECPEPHDGGVRAHGTGRRSRCGWIWHGPQEHAVVRRDEDDRRHDHRDDEDDD